jgi:Methyl-accepting chemotaxis protein (MCP) signalling domain
MDEAGASEATSGQDGPVGQEAEPRAADQVVHSAVAVARASTALSLIGHQIRAATASQGARLQEVRTAMATVSEGAEAVAAHAAESSTIAGETQQQARAGAEMVADVATGLVEAGEAASRSLELIDTLGERVAEVGTIADKIDQIAAKTKLLSLNAAIEAARAGEHGRGFSVVAKEINVLAAATAEAAAMIGAIVDAVQTARNESSSSADTIRDTTQRMDDGIARAADSFSRIVVDVDRLSAISADVASTSAVQANIAQTLATTAEAIAGSARSTLASADELGDAIDHVERSADAVGAAAIIAIAGEAGRASAAALERFAADLAPILALARKQAARFHAVYEEAVARRGGTILREDMAALDPSIHEAIGRYRGMLCGTGAAPVANLLGDVSLWLQWWTNEPEGPVFLECDWDPRSPTFYDYPKLEWFREPTTRLEPWVAGPFFDGGATNLHIVTISAPVIVDGAAIGVAAADMRLDQIDRLCSPRLHEVGRRAALVSRDGRVVSSTDASWCAAGDMLEPELAQWCTRAMDDHWTVGPEGQTLARMLTFPWGVLSFAD